MTVTKNTVVTLTIKGMTAQGSGVGRLDDHGEKGMAVFVPYTAVGDVLRCRIVRVEKRFAYGIVEELLTPSPDRREDCGCAVYGKCGGCVFRHVRYEAELRYKQQQVTDAFARIGALTPPIHPIVGGEQPDGYRNKAQFPVGGDSAAPRIGFYAPRSHRIVEQRHCALQPPVFGEILDAVADWMRQASVVPYDEQSGSGFLRHIYLREAAVTGEVMVCLVCTSGKLPRADLLLQALAPIKGIASVCVNINRRDTNVVLGEMTFAVSGQSAIIDELCGLRFRLSPRSFYQVNHDQAQRLYALAAEAAALTGTETMLDLYCGTGTIGLSMAAKAKTLIGAEIVPQAVEDARRNAEENGVENARFLCADASEAAAQLEREGVRPDVVVIDPPRKGCEESVIDTIARMQPQRVVYVSCDPATLARDCARFAARGYETRYAVPVDMFPRTAHVETVVLMSR